MTAFAGIDRGDAEAVRITRGHEEDAGLEEIGKTKTVEGIQAGAGIGPIGFRIGMPQSLT